MSRPPGAPAGGRGGGAAVGRDAEAGPGGRPGARPGRAAEHTRMRDAVRAAASGRGGAVRVLAEPGGGRTRLLAEAADEAERLGLRVHAGTADRRAAALPLAPLLDCLRGAPWAPGPELLRAWSGRGDFAVTALAEWLYDELPRHCADVPVVLVLDDLHAADEATRLVWRRLEEKAGGLALLLVSAEVPGLASGDGGPGPSDVIRLEPYGDAEALSCAAALLGAPPPAPLAARIAGASGNPALLGALVRADALPPARAGAALRTAVHGHLRHWDADGVERLRLAALLGEDFSATELAALTRLPVTDLFGFVESTLESGLFAPRPGERLAFRQPLVREVLVEAVPPALRQALRRTAAEALHEAGAPAERVLAQLHGNVAELDAWTVNWLVGNAQRLVTRAPERAFEVMQDVIERTDPADPQRRFLEQKLGDAAYVLRHPAAVGLVRRLAESATDVDRRASLSFMLVELLLTVMRFTEAVEAVEGARRAPGLSAVWTARLKGVHALALWCSGSHPGADALVREMESDGHEDALARSYAHHVAHLLAVRGHAHEEALRHLDLGIAALRGVPGADDMAFRLYINRGIVLGKLERLDAACDAMGEALALARASGNRRRVDVAAGAAATLAYWAGRWDEALKGLESVRDDGTDVSAPLHRHGLGALVLGHQDLREEADRHLDRVDDLPIMPGVALNHASYLLLARALRAERRGDPAGALAVLLPTLDPEVGKDNDQRFHWYPDMVRLALEAGDTATAARVVEAAEEEAAKGPAGPGRRAAALRCRGLFAQDPAPLAEALEYYEASGRRLLWGQALEDLAVAQAWRGDLDASRETLHRAVDLYAPLRAEWDVARADARLRPLGVRRGRRTAHRRATTGWEALTPTELKVARRVAAGRSNPEIAAELLLSRRTVQTHVSHILGKLGVRSRTEVAREAALHLSESA
ncbi:LuxR family transcriptional regulator [Streptomyces sp. NPDC001941]|uniref:helix-turn-helix transcriptional regulator n=1 Tax=Streptomyces sp. NPDC001941 TaxID=3154659 RepID=UPI003328BB9D